MTYFSWLRTVLDRYHHWWMADRVRISPREGALWRLHPGCLLTIDGNDFEVCTNRRVQKTVEFHCKNEDAEGMLLLKSTPQAPFLKVFWMTGNCQRELAPADVQIWWTKPEVIHQLHR